MAIVQIEKENACNPIRDKWYNNRTFPIQPQLYLKKADYHNTSTFTFHWLVFKAWNLDSLQLEFAFVLDTHWGLGITMLLPYMRLVVAIPCPEKFAHVWSKWTDRKSQVIKESVSDL